MGTVTASEARQNLSEQLDAVERGEDVRITRHGKVVAVLVKPERLVNPRAASAFEAAARLRAELDEARTQPLLEPTMSVEEGETLVADIRAGRDAR